MLRIGINLSLMMVDWKLVKAVEMVSPFQMGGGGSAALCPAKSLLNPVGLTKVIIGEFGFATCSTQFNSGCCRTVPATHNFCLF